MANIRDDIKTILTRAISRVQKDGRLKEFVLDGIELEIAQEEKFGDYTSNVALRYAKEAGMPPREFAQLLCRKINASKKKNAVFSRVEVAGPGFLNFFLSEDFLRAQIEKIVEAGVTNSVKGKKKKVNIEFLSANPTGQIQVGNARLGFYGDVLGNVLQEAGWEVTKEYYVNNAKTSNQIGELGKTALGKGLTYLTPYIEKKIKELASKLQKIKGRAAKATLGVAGIDSATPGVAFAEAGFLLANSVQKDTAETLAKKAGIRFNVRMQEEELYKRKLLQKTFALLRRKKLIYEQEGALWLRTTKFGDDKDKVVVRSSGMFGYYLADIAYHRDKISRGYNTIIDVFGADHQGHVKPMEIAMKVLGYKGRFSVLIGQLVQAKGGGRLSKRRGGALTLEELIDEVGIDAVRFFYVARSLDTQMEFDIDLAREQSEKNPVYYVQYTHARMCSIIKKSKIKSQKSKTQIKNQKEQNEKTHRVLLELLSGPGELRLMRKLAHFLEIIESISQDFQVHRLTTYTLELAQEFNQFYRDYRVLTEDAHVQAGRLMLTEASKTVLARCLALLGIRAPQRM